MPLISEVYYKDFPYAATPVSLIALIRPSSPAPPGVRRKCDRRRIPLLVFVACLAPVYWIALAAPAAGIFHDDGIYLVTAKALAEGKGYRIISLPSEIPQTKYPPAFPALLSLAWRMFPAFPDNLLALKMIPLLFLVLWVVVFRAWLRRAAGDREAMTWIPLLFLASPQAVFFGSTVLSETTFAFLSVCSVYCMMLSEKDPSGPRALLVGLASLFASAAFLTRTLGISLIVSAPLYLVYRRRYRLAGLFLVCCAVLTSPWLLWQYTEHVAHGMDQQYYSASNYKDWNVLFNYDLNEKVSVISLNILSFLVSPASFYPMGSSIAGMIFSFFFAIFTFAGFREDLRGGWTPAHFFLVAYVAICLCWLWPPARFCVPIFPFIMYFCYRGLSLSVGKRGSPAASRKVVAALAAFLFGTAVGLSLLSGSLETVRKSSPSIGYARSDDWRQVRRMFDWVRRESKADSVVLGNLDPTCFLYTGRKAVRGFEADPYKLWYTLRKTDPIGSERRLSDRIAKTGANYVLRTPSEFFHEGEYFNDLLDQVIARRPGLLSPVDIGLDPGYAIYRVNGSGR